MRRMPCIFHDAPGAATAAQRAVRKAPPPGSALSTLRSGSAAGYQSGPGKGSLLRRLQSLTRGPGPCRPSTYQAVRRRSPVGLFAVLVRARPCSRSGCRVGELRGLSSNSGYHGRSRESRWSLGSHTYAGTRRGVHTVRREEPTGSTRPTHDFPLSHLGECTPRPPVPSTAARVRLKCRRVILATAEARVGSREAPRWIPPVRPRAWRSRQVGSQDLFGRPVSR